MTAPMNPSSFDIVIAGGGLVGASCALALGRQGIRTALIDADAPVPAGAEDWDARIYALSPASVRFLDEIGVWSHVDAQRMALCSRMEIAGDHGGSMLRFDAYEAGVSALAYMLESRALAHAIEEALQSVACVSILRSDRVVGLTRDASAASVALASHQTLRCSLLVGADGANSAVRELAGINAQRFDYPEQGVVANFSISNPHHGCAFQWFRGDSVLALLPLPGNRMSMVWSVQEAEAKRLLALSEQALADVVGAAAGGRLGQMEVITPPRSFPLTRLSVADPVGLRVALIGDAAHVVHPLAGQGVNLGFGDALALAEVVAERGSILDPGAMRLLRRFRRRRAEPILAMLAMTHGLHSVFALPGDVPRFLRNAGLNLVHRLPVVRSILARHAMG
jgi:2-polyprenylphenol 6-hydroxylase